MLDRSNWVRFANFGYVLLFRCRFFSRTPGPPPFSSMNSNSIGNWLPDQNKKTGKMNFLRENDYSQVVSAEGLECELQRVRASADDLRISPSADYKEAARDATQS